MSILRLRAVLAETGHRSHASIYSAVHAGTFTMPVQIGERSVGWPSDEVQAINAARIAGKSDADIRALVDQLHAARCANTGEPFKPTWLEKSAEQKQQAAHRTKRTKRAAPARVCKTEANHG
ncbi:phage transcriptional regulator, AlpA [Rhodoferax ferrireducens T118]|uniref:Phage transcriptional regulator, AlpA n=1 Tax=Albidiferax ferrireducens (strain ATCC BAA-621 / DSM 15236 / T118) TaxID=338969 RepID=Q21UK9_ALBFT|nr:AlpA family phage regulatory protein [Rhodoferax ferrireducens]ABD70544.1 phage transcriptional regulator, AlpA [Rhodoferax ferrireducens T118]